MRQRHILILFAALLMSAICSTSSAGEKLIDRHLDPETLDYKVMFKWGLINKQAGTATLSLTNDRRNYTAMLSAASEPWADRIFRVRDTLKGRMAYKDFTPLYYEKIAHEGAEHKHDVVRYDYSCPGQVHADCIRKVYKKGELKVDETRRLESKGPAVDMLTSFYYMRSLPFEDWKPGKVVTVDIFSGKRKELLSIIYHGIDSVDVGGKEMKAYHVSFTFTSGNGKKTSDDMDAWIGLGKNRIPLRLEGKLPVGKVHCIFAGSR